MDSSLVQIPAILGALKCAFATALIEERRKGNTSLEGNVAYGTLTLNVAATRSVDVGVKGNPAAGGPFVFSFAGGTGSILPKFSAATTYTNTLKTEIDFRYYLWARDNEACSLVDGKTQEAYGFTEWLSSVISGLDVNSREYPRGQADAIRYETSFGVLKKNSVGTDFDFVILSGSANLANERGDVQALKLFIAPVSDDNPLPDIWSKKYAYYIKRR